LPKLLSKHNFKKGGKMAKAKSKVEFVKTPLKDLVKEKGITISLEELECDVTTWAPGTYKLTILGIFSATRGEIGWYAGNCRWLMTLLSRGSVAGASATFTAECTFGLYLNSPTPGHCNLGGLYFTETSLNPDGFQHAKVFCLTDTKWIIAWEDWCGGGDRDYNDYILLLEKI